jgi:hypothetical protein
MNRKFAKLERVELRELWNGGATDFTFWLSEEENLADLGSLLGMELRVLEQEQKLQTLRTELLCKNLLTEQFVFIENQLEQTDNSHLGKIISHLAAMKADTIIWIARTFTEEHRLALNWLNGLADKSLNFIGIEVDAFKIGDSLPAPDFKVVISPGGWVKQVTKPLSSQKDTDIKQLQKQYWQGLKAFMEENNSYVKLPTPPPDSWYNIPFGGSKYFLSAAINSQDISLNIWMTIIGEKAKEEFDKLYELAYKDSLIEINQNLIWDRMQADIKCAVTLKTYADYQETDDRINQYSWFKENLEKFDKFFRPRFKQL